MILQSLNRLYDRLKDDPDYGLCEQGFSYQKIAFKVVIRPDGSLFDIQDARVPQDGKLLNRRVKVLGQTKSTGSGLNPCTLWDNAAYMLGYKKDDPKPERTRKTFEAFRDHHLALRDEIGSPSFDAVCRFLENWDPDSVFDESGACRFPILDETGFGVFQILGETGYVHEDPAIVEWWERRLAEKADAARKIMGQCLITGKEAPIARLHPKLRGIAGGQRAGASLVSYNEDAYESYAKEQSFNAPVSEEAAFRYTQALNALLDGPMAFRHKITLADATVVFWTEKPTTTEDIFAPLLGEGVVSDSDLPVQDEMLRTKLQAFLAALRKGGRAENEGLDDPHTPFYLLALSPNAGRTSVRLFLQSSVGQLMENLARHFRDICVERTWKEDSRNPDPLYPSFRQLLRQTARDAKEIPPLLAAPLLEAALYGTRYPQGLFSAVIRRLHAGDAVNYLKACVIKGYLVRNQNMEVTMTLDKQRKEPGYVLGRLFAVLEKTQEDALGTVNAGLRERFYSSASATPAAVFPRILRVHQHHLAKLSGGIRVNREKLLQDITDNLAKFPRFLSLDEQGLFALGYYHQRKDLFTRNEEKEEVEAV